MNIQVKELNDGRYIGLGIFEVTSFPMLEGSARDIEVEMEQAYNSFLYTLQEFFKLGQDSNTMAELFWVSDKVEKQTFRSRIRIFCIVRRISPKEVSLQTHNRNNNLF